MVEKRLEEIKDSIDLHLKLFDEQTYAPGLRQILNEEIELYNEVVRLRNIIDEVTKKITGTTICGLRAGKSVIGLYLNELLNILNNSNLTIENLSGIENE